MVQVGSDGWWHWNRGRNGARRGMIASLTMTDPRSPQYRRCLLLPTNDDWWHPRPPKPVVNRVILLKFSVYNGSMARICSATINHNPLYHSNQNEGWGIHTCFSHRPALRFAQSGRQCALVRAESHRRPDHDADSRSRGAADGSGAHNISGLYDRIDLEYSDSYRRMWMVAAA